MFVSAGSVWKGFAMLSISTSQPVGWSTPAPLAAVAPLSAVSAVGSVKSSARESQADSGRNGQGSPNGGAALRRAGDSPMAGQAAPLLPREPSDDRSASPASQFEERQLRSEQQKVEDQKAREKAEQKLQLQEVLTTVWKASAAVVDVVLGRDAGAKAAEEPTPTAIPGATPSAETLSPSGESFDMMSAVRREQEPMAYTVQGASSWPPVETGQLVDQRV